jgi:hypothetical protein
MTLTEFALRGSEIRVGPVNRLAVGLPWFRSTPLAALVDAELRIDDRAVHDLGLEVAGLAVPVDALAVLTDRYWSVQERRVLTWTDPLPPGAEEVDAVLRLRLHLPFLTGPDGRSVQVLQEARACVPVRRAA